MRTFLIAGRITKTGTNVGLHGLLTRAFEKRKYLNDKELGSALSSRNGDFNIRFRRSKYLQFFSAKPVVYFKVYDRDDNLIYTSGQSYHFQSEESLQTNIEVPAEVLENHLSRPTSLELKTGHLLSRKKMDPVFRAIELLAERGTPEHARFIHAMLCPLPSIDRFENLLGDSWDVLNGDLEAEHRLQDIFELLERTEARSGLRNISSQEGSFQEVINQFVQRAANLAPVNSIIERNEIIPFILAAGLSAGANPQRLDKHLSIAFGQLEAYHSFAMLHAAAEMALSGGAQERAYFRAVLLTLEDWCGPDGFPFPSDRFPEAPEPSVPPNLERAEHWDCTASAVRAIHTIRSRYGFFAPPRVSSETYTIDSITPAIPCIGDTMVINGRGFTSSPGVVRFTGGRWRRRTPVDVSATEWSDTRIIVTVPDESGCGPISLRIPVERFTVGACDAFFDFSTYRSPTTTVNFLGCRPRITFFGIEGGRTCVARGEAVTLHWSVEPDDAAVIISERLGSETRELYNGSESAGSVALETSTSGTRVLSITVNNVHSDCGSEVSTLTRLLVFEVGGPVPVLSIPGIELTQGIQRFTLADPADPTNNSISLVAGMDTVIRVYVTSDRGGFDMDIARVTGRLVFRGRIYRPINGARGTPRGSSPIIDAKPSPNRNEVNDSLNFLIPAAEANGEDETLSIEVFTADRCDGYASAYYRGSISWLERPALPVTIRRIADPGTGDVISEDEALRIVTEAFDRLPSPRTEIRLRPGVFSIHPGTTEANYCRDGGFYQLALSVAYEHNDVEGLWPDPHESVWIGLFFQAGCTSGGMMSWPWTSTCISQRDTAIAAHEIAHCVGMGHTRTGHGEGCAPDDSSRGYAKSQPVACHDLPEGGRLTDVVFDIRNNRVWVGAWDLMSYHSGYRYPHPIHWEAIRERMDTRF